MVHFLTSERCDELGSTKFSLMRRTFSNQAENINKKCTIFLLKRTKDGIYSRLQSKYRIVNLEDQDWSIRKPNTVKMTSSLPTLDGFTLQSSEGFTSDQQAARTATTSFQDYGNVGPSPSLCNGQAIKSCHSPGRTASIARISLDPASPMNQT